MQKNETPNNPVLFAKSEQIYLKSATSFVQYMINISLTEEPRFRLVTLIGEKHNTEFDCDNSSISVSDYVTNYIDKDPNTMVLLEMDRNQYYTSKIPKSVPIRSILIKKNNNDESYHRYLKYYDPRNLFLGMKDRYALYNSKITLEHSDTELWNIYGLPFYEKWTELSSAALSTNLYGKEQLFFLTDILAKSIESNFKQVGDILHSDADSSKCIHKLRICWLKVTDWFILSILLDSNSNSNTAIAIMGNLHLTHIVDQILLTNGMINDSRNGKEGACVNLFETVSMVDLSN